MPKVLGSECDAISAREINGLNLYGKDEMLMHFSLIPADHLIFVMVGSSGYFAEITKSEAISLVTTVGQSLKLVISNGETEITGAKD